MMILRNGEQFVGAVSCAGTAWPQRIAYTYIVHRRQLSYC